METGCYNGAHLNIQQKPKFSPDRRCRHKKNAKRREEGRCVEEGVFGRSLARQPQERMAPLARRLWGRSTYGSRSTAKSLTGLGGLSRRARLVVEELDNRDTPSAVPVGLEALDLHWIAQQQLINFQNEAYQSREDSLVKPAFGSRLGVDVNLAPSAVRYEVIIVDGSVPDLDRMVRQLETGLAPGTWYDLYLLDSRQGGVEQITSILNKYNHQLDAVHLVSHGEVGSLFVGADQLDLARLQTFSEEVAGWGQAFARYGDLLLYGCDVAADGGAMAAQLQRLIGVDVAASTDRTGAAALGGDWQLEFQLGQIDASSLGENQRLDAWVGVLAPEPLVLERVQSGGVTMDVDDDPSTPGIQRIVTLATPVDPSRSFVLGTHSRDSSSPQLNPTFELTGGGTTVTITSSAASSGLFAEWQVVTFSSGVQVHRGLETFAPGNTTRNVSLTSIDLSRSFVLTSSRMDTDARDQDERRTILAQFTSDTNLRLTRSESGIAVPVAWQVIEFLDPSVTVQSGTTTIDSGSTSATASFTNNAGAEWLVFNTSGSAGVNGLESAYQTRGQFTSPTQITFDRLNSTGTVTTSWFVVSMPGASVQSGSQEFSDTPGEDDFNVTLSPVNTSRSITLISSRGGDDSDTTPSTPRRLPP